MSRAPVTVAILAWNSWDTTKACLDSLRPTLGIRDQVVVVDNGSTDATPTGLSQYPWIDVVTNRENRGFAGGCNDAAAHANRDIIVFLNNDTILAPRWLDPLVDALGEPGVGAVGPRSNFVSGPQVVSEAVYSTPAEMRRFARQWAADHRDERSDANRLVGFCLAVRRDVFEAVGRFDEGYGIGGFEDDDLCQRILKAGHRLVICHDSFVHHEGHKTFDVNGLDWMAEQEANRSRYLASHHASAPIERSVLVSACLIVKDEETNLPGCLRSLEGVADQVVVYDTGSVDRTCEIAAEHGAEVIQGYWDDDFSRARNAALGHCRGEWVVWLDADETLQPGDPTVLRNMLSRTRADIDAWSVRIQNLTGSGAGSEFTHHAARIFRRARCEWTGRLHEQIARRGDHSPIVQAELEKGAWIRHTGYLDEMLKSRNKAERNLRVAQAELDAADGWEKGYSLVSLGRSLLLAGQPAEGLARVTEALDHSENGITRRLAVRAAVDASVALGDLDGALEWCDRLREEGADPNTSDAMEATVRVACNDWDRVLELLDQVDVTRIDSDGFSPAAGLVAAQRAQALFARGDYSRAADSLIASLYEDGVLDTHLGTLIDCLHRAGRPLDELAAAIPEERIALFLAQVLQLHPEPADQLLEAALGVRRDHTAVLAAASKLAVRLPLERALIWSFRLRQAGQAGVCPLITIALNDADQVVRARAAAVARASFDDERAVRAFVEAHGSATVRERRAIESETEQICPALLSHIAIPGAAGPERSRSRVTIVIPCFNHADLTLGCLQSLSRSTEPDLFEIVLVDNGSEDATSRLTEGQFGPNFRIVRNASNLGVGPACNQGAALASTDYICFLNNDTLLQPGWLEPLVAALDEDPRLAAVQPRLIYPDGRLNDAGGLVFRGGHPWVYGKDHPNPDAPEFATRRAPDYASGACLMVRRSAFEEVGGFDDRYAPAYFEDTDLSFELRAHGWKVLYEPSSTVVHVEGGTVGTDTAVGLKQYQARNFERFSSKWAADLAGRDPLDPDRVDDWAHRPQAGQGPGESLNGLVPGEYLGSPGRGGSRILVIDVTMPAFDRASGSLRSFLVLQCLREAGHSVTYYAVDGGDRYYADAVGRFGVTCYGVDTRKRPSDRQPQIYAPVIPDLLARREFDVVMVSPWTLGEQIVEQVRELAPSASVWLDTNDVHFVRLERAAAVSRDPGDAGVARATRERELAVYRTVDRILAVSEPDAAVLRAEIPDADIRVVPNAHPLPDPGPGFDDRAGSLFVGNFNHRPNLDALDWWAAEIAPLLDPAAPATDLTVVGNDPLGAAARRAGRGLTVVGAVSSTLPYLHRAMVSVAPLRYGAGMKGKVGEALAAGLPVVTTTVGAEGMGLVDGVHVLIADTPTEFAEAVRRLQGDRPLWEALREGGRRHIAEHFGVERMRREIASLLGDQVATSV